MARVRLVIVPRRDPQLFQYLSHRLAGVPHVELILDRRAAERRRSVKPAPNRRRAERRTPAFRIGTTLGCAMISVDREAPPTEPGPVATGRTLLWPALRVKDLPPPATPPKG